MMNNVGDQTLGDKYLGGSILMGHLRERSLITSYFMAGGGGPK